MLNFFIRSLNNPILKPNRANSWEDFKLYNPGAIFDGEKYHLFYRAMNRGEDWRSSIGHAVSADGENFERFDEPVLKAETVDEKRGLEDPRVTKIGDEYFMAYAAYDGKEVKLNIAVSQNLADWEKRGPALRKFDFLEAGGHRIKFKFGCGENADSKIIGKERSKSGAIFPEKINGKYWMLFGEYNIWLANSDDCLRWDVIDGPFLSARDGQFFDNGFVETGPVPIKTDRGWLVLYHGIDRTNTYRLGFLLLDLDDPAKIIYRHSEPIFQPEEGYEFSTLVDVMAGGVEEMQKRTDKEIEAFYKHYLEMRELPTVVFCCGAVALGDNLRIYYGAGDSVICTATGKISEILNLIT